MRTLSHNLNNETLASANDGVILTKDIQGAGLVPWVPRNYTTGLKITKDTDTVNDLNITAGECADSNNAYMLILLTEITKQADNTWAEGDDAGGTRAGDHPISASTQYYVYLMRKDIDGTKDVIITSEASSPTLPSGWTAHRLIGYMYRNATPANSDISYNLNSVTEIGEWTPTILDASLDPNESQTYTTQNATFTRIGNQMVFQGEVEALSVASLTSGDQCSIGGLPHVSHATNVSGAVSFGYGSSYNLGSGNNDPTGLIIANVSHIQLWVWGALTTSQIMTVNNVGDANLVFHGSYIAA